MWRANRGRTGEGDIDATDLDIAQMCLAIDARSPVEERSVSCGLAVFEELGFAEVERVRDGRRIRMADRPGRVELSRSIRYLEGLRARLEFSDFRDWALTAPASDMLSRINRPITPRSL